MLFTPLFNEKLLVAEEYIAATVGLRKKCQSLKGAAGTKCKRLIAEYAATEKKLESKIKFMKVPEGQKVPRDSNGSKSKGFVIPDAEALQIFPPPLSRRAGGTHLGCHALMQR